MTSTTHVSFDKNTYATDVAAAFPAAIKDRTILITGVNKLGIGYTTAEAFASQNAHCIIIAGRSEPKIRECVDALGSLYPDTDVRSLIVDLASQHSIRTAASEIMDWKDVPKIDLVINNAGIMRHGESFEGEVPTNEDGIEEMFATNHLGHFLLTNLIMPKIIAASKENSPGSTRIINISSSGAFVSPFRASDLEWRKPSTQLPENESPSFKGMRMAGMTVSEETAYIPTAAYGHSKTCNVLFSVGLNKRLSEKYGILSLALNPGDVQTELARSTNSDWLSRMIKKREEMGLMHWKTPGQGASTTLIAACDSALTLPDDDGNGYYLSDCQITKAPAWSVNKGDAEKLWQISEGLVREKFSL